VNESWLQLAANFSANFNNMREPLVSKTFAFTSMSLVTKLILQLHRFAKRNVGCAKRNLGNYVQNKMGFLSLSFSLTQKLSFCLYGSFEKEAIKEQFHPNRKARKSIKTSCWESV